MEDLNTTPVQASAPEAVTPEPVVPGVAVPADEKLFATFCYIPVISILSAPYAVSKFPKSTFVGVHAAQGLGLFVVWFLNLVVISALSLMLSGLFVLGLIILSVYGGMMAWAGKEVKFPVVLQIGEKLLGFIKGFVVKKGKEVVDGMNNAVSKAGEAIGVTTPPAQAQPVQPEPKVEAQPVVEEEVVVAPEPVAAPEPVTTPEPQVQQVAEVPAEVKPDMPVAPVEPKEEASKPEAPKPEAPKPEEVKPMDTPPAN